MNLAQKLAIGYIKARINILALVSTQRAAKKAFDIFCTPMRRTRNKPSRVFDKGEPLSFKLEGNTLRGHRWLPHQASGDSLEKVLIVHGFESASSNFDQYIGAFLKKGYEVIAFDAPAHGASDGKKITLPLYIQTIRSIYERYGPIKFFMGHSFGGLALCLFLESLPADKSFKLVLVAPATAAANAVDSFFQMLQINPELRPEFDRLILEISGFPISHFSIRRAMGQIAADTLWVQDEDDRITPLADALPIKEDRHPNLRFIITSGLGHRKVYRDADVIRQIADFL
ncbi:MAG TPA: alpha/beta hydrolase [Puia sp.]|nr:alpha/beta hydrolase [Puia sp.]